MELNKENATTAAECFNRFVLSTSGLNGAELRFIANFLATAKRKLRSSAAKQRKRKAA